MKGQAKYVSVHKNSGEVLIKLKSRGFRATSLSTYDFSSLYTTLHHNLIKEKLLNLTERACKKISKNEGTLFCYERDFMTSLSDDNQADIIEALTQPLDVRQSS